MATPMAARQPTPSSIRTTRWSRASCATWRLSARPVTASWRSTSITTTTRPRPCAPSCAPPSTAGARSARLARWPDSGRPAFGFIHGNWALDNSRLENGRNFCGVNDEITVLAQEGCYADFTFPALAHMAQPRQANSIFYATDDPDRPKSYDRGEEVRAGGQPSGDLMIVQGPLCIRRKRGRCLPSPEDGDVTGTNPATPERVDAWVRTAIHLPGRPEWIFVKVHTHGAADRNLEGLLAGGFEALFADLEQRYNDGRRLVPPLRHRPRDVQHSESRRGRPRRRSRRLPRLRHQSARRARAGSIHHSLTLCPSLV